MAELGLSLREYNRQVASGWAIAARHMIGELKKTMRAQGLRPREGIHEWAVAEIARQQGSPVLLERRLPNHSA
jgi:hypothetical protein